MSIVRDKGLAREGAKKIEWVRRHMPLLSALEERFLKEKPFDGLDLTMSIHLEAKTARAALLFKAGGARVRATGCNPLSTQDDVAAALSEMGVEVFAWHGATPEEYHAHLIEALSSAPSLILDDGGDVTQIMHDKYPEMLAEVRGLSEETTTGVHRLYEMMKKGTLKVPAINVNDSVTKSKFDNLYGCRESLVDGIKRATDVMVAGKVAVVAGYGDVGKGSAASLRSQGARVLVTEIDPITALQAAMEGYQVVTMDDAAPQGDIFVTATGNVDVITLDHMRAMKDRAIVCNIGHFDSEIQIEALRNYKWEEVKPQVDEVVFPDGKRLIVLAQGRLVNLGCATGHPSFVMSASFTNQVLAQIELWTNAASYENKVYVLPKHLDEKVARLHLDKIGAKLTTLSAKQAEYIGVKVEGPFKPDHYRY